jgi:hypothetical protein
MIAEDQETAGKDSRVSEFLKFCLMNDTLEKEIEMYEGRILPTRFPEA